MAPSAKFWDRIAARYAKHPIADEATYQEKLRITREFLRPDSEVVEIGCGTGSTAIAHAPFAKHIRATDLSAKMVEIAREKAAAEGVSNIAFEQASVEALTVADGSVDMVMAHSLLHLVADRDAAIAKAHAMLRPGGVLVASTICLADAMPLARLALPIARLLGKAPMVKFFTEKALVNSVERAGFAIERRWSPGKRKALFLVARKP